jgi:Rad3-related DNA helicase
MEYAVPQAILRLRQGFGRLIRTKSDRGVAVLLDKRLVSRRYGKSFLNSLPPAKFASCQLHELDSVITDWMAK